MEQREGVIRLAAAGDTAKLLRDRMVGRQSSIRCELHDEPRTVTTCELIRSDPLDPPDSGKVKVTFSYSIGDCPVCPMDRAGVPPLFRRCSFENFRPDSPELAHNLARTRDFAAAPAGFLFLLGLPGTGKTHLAVSCIRSMRQGTYTRHHTLVEALRRSYGLTARERRHLDSAAGFSGDEPSARILERARETSILVLDELGVAPGGNDAETILFDILDRRVSHLLPTIICANIEPDKLEAHFGSRIADRFRQARFDLLKFTGGSFRKAGNLEYLEAARLAQQRRTRPFG
ncbi:MAG: ATP-binding protein [Verrucomicrobiota bacterium]